MIALVIFDVDGTLAKTYTLKILPGVQAFFDLLYRAECPSRPLVAIATNQGGVGLRHWMEQERFGNPKGYPTTEMIEKRMHGLLEILGAPPNLPVYVAYRYQNRAGKWGPIPLGMEEAPRWKPTWRKPDSGMLLQAMQDAGVAPEQTLFVGDREDDQGAAQTAGCHFAWAQDFFARDWSDCQALAAL